MGRTKISKDHKAKSITVSVFPKHVTMLEYMEKVLKGSRSDIIQRLLEKEYNEVLKMKVDVEE